MRMQLHHFELLKKIGDIRFTSREIDIISGIIHARSAKKIASLLSINPKTVENYTHNIMVKIGCGSRDGIIDFIESSGKIQLLRQYYNALLVSEEFEKCLKEIASTNPSAKINSILLEEKNSEFKKPLLAHLESDLILAGLFPIANNVVFKTTKNAFSIKIKGTSPEKQQIINLNEEKDYYGTFFLILRNLIDTAAFDELIKQFNQTYERLTLNPAPKVIVISENEPYSLPSEGNENKLKYKNIIYASLCLFFFASLIYVVSYSYNNFEFVNNKDIIARSDLIIPLESARIDRNDLLTEIDNQFQKQNGIKSIALVGIGGSGKTTLARQYALSQKSPVVWEINAETPESLKNSFESLAMHLAKSEQELKILNEIQDLKNPSHKEEQILSFVKNKLRTIQNWFLILDNVENFSDIQKYYPADATVWGKGKVILTTRDYNIRHNNQIPASLLIGELKEAEKYDLFSKIMNTESGDTALLQNTKEEKEFMDRLPPFPLDISVAAYYLKTTQIPYKEYFNNLDSKDTTFVSIQENVLKDFTNYSETRYQIVTTSLKHLINSHSDFRDLFLLISLIDSQNIPKYILYKYKEKPTVDSFIYNLNKYSLINATGSRPDSDSALSIHRSTHEIALNYLKKDIYSKNNKETLDKIMKTIQSVMATSIDEEDFSKMKTLVPHAQIFLKNIKLISQFNNDSISSELGGILYYLGHTESARKVLETYIESPKIRTDSSPRALAFLGVLKKKTDINEAKRLLEKSLAEYEELSSKDYTGIALALVFLGGIYEALEDHEKAQKCLERGIAIYKNHLTDNHVGAARAYSYLGILNRKIGSYQEAISLFNKCLSIYEKIKHKNHIGIAQAMTHLGNTFADLGQYKQAQAYFEQSQKICKKNFSDRELCTAWGLRYLGNVYNKLGRYEEARKTLEKSLNIYEKHYNGTTLNEGDIRVYLGNAYEKLGNLKECQKNLEISLSIFKEHLPGDHSKILSVITSLASALQQLGEHNQAKVLLEANMEHFTSHLLKLTARSGDLKIGQANLYLGENYKNLRNYNKSTPHFLKSYELFKKHYGNDHIETAFVLQKIGQIYLLENQIDPAEKVLKQALVILQKNEHPDTFRLLEDLAELYQKKDKLRATGTKTLQCLNEALEIVKVHFSPDSPHIKRVYEKLDAFSSP